MHTISLKNVTKIIQKRTVLKNIEQNFESGKIYGLYGINSSGKTMLLRAIAGIIIPTTGVVKIEGKQLHKDISFPPSMGIIIENTSLLEDYDAQTNLKMLAKIKKIATDEDISNALTRVGLDPSSKLKVKKFSLGMKQRLSIAQAIFEKPMIILLDEPTNALDPAGIELIRNLLVVEKERGALIILASHNEKDIELLSDINLKMQDGTLCVSHE